jgi:hypothetical protein
LAVDIRGCPGAARKLGRRAAHDRDVDLLARKHAHDLVAVTDLQLDLDLRMLLGEVHQHRRQQVLGRRDGADTQRSGEDALQRGHLFAGLAPQVEDAPRIAGQQLPGLGQPDAAPGALQERRAGRFFERADLDRYRGLREVHLVGRQRHAAEPGHGMEGGELAKARVLGKRHGVILGLRHVNVKRVNFS